MGDMGGVPDEPWGSTAPCPRCGTAMRAIAWGYPLMDDPLMEASARGEVFLGGCIVPDEPIPQWFCPRCDRLVHLTEGATQA